MRKHGLAIDSLVAVEVVTADGRIVTASEHQHQGPFWAIRGGGGNFGVVTCFVYRASPLGMTLAGGFGVAATVDAVSALVELAEAAPEELTVIAFVMAALPLPIVPPRPSADSSCSSRSCTRVTPTMGGRRSGRSRRSASRSSTWWMRCRTRASTS